MAERARSRVVVAIYGLVASMLIGSSVLGQTIVVDPIRPVPDRPQRHVPLTVAKHLVDVSILDGVAQTSIDQVFVNPHKHQIEGTYIFPLADDVALSKFSMFINDQEVEGRLLGVEEARREYESIVSRMRDPALLEYVGSRMFKARIFPIEPGGQARVRLAYAQMLTTDDGLVRYRFPMNTERYLAAPVDLASVLVNIESKVPIRSVFSPTHKIAVNRPSDRKASASFEGRNIFPGEDFELLYTLSAAEFGLSMFTYREAGEDGYFLLRVSPPTSVDPKDVLPKDICFVVDTSGSMEGEKLEQAVAALRFCLGSLNEQDRFNVIPFSHEPIRFRNALVPASRENIKEAKAFAEGLAASGGTNIHDALLAALDAAPDGGDGRPYLVVFLTDGQPTIGNTQPDEILAAVRGKNAERVRLFVFGVGHDVNTRLLDLLAEQNRGARDYVEPGEDLELRLSSFYKKVAHPALADLSLSFGDVRTYDMYPPRLGDLFSGTELVVAGRYAGQGPKAIELTGMRRGAKERFVYETTFPEVDKTHAFLPRLWATRKVGFLLDEMRLHGENKELRDTIVKLAIEHGIVTPYTAYLVTEPGRLVEGRRRSNLLADALGEEATFNVADADADNLAAAGAFARRKGGSPPAPAARVRDSRDAAALQAAEALPDTFFAACPPNPGGASTTVGTGGKAEAKKKPLLRRVGTRTFYSVGDRWIDAGYEDLRDAKTGALPETIKVDLFGATYFKLIRDHADLAKCFALGERMVVVVDGRAYETVPAAQSAASTEE